jgi:hypothetical protein
VEQNVALPGEVNEVGFFRQDKFMLLSSRNRLLMYKYNVDEQLQSDLIKLKSTGKYKVVYSHEAVIPLCLNMLT